MVMGTYRCWERCQPPRSGTGTKMAMAFLPWPTSICKNPGVSENAAQCPPPLRPGSRVVPSIPCPFFFQAGAAAKQQQRLPCMVVEAMCSVAGPFRDLLIPRGRT